MKKHGTTILLFLILFLGLSLMLYPSFSDYWNSLHQSQAIASYAEQVAHLDQDRYSEIWEEALRYNENLTRRTNSYVLSDEQKREYERLLNLGETGIMGYVEIPFIGVTLPVYHGTDDAVLQVAVGHLEWTSLPTGGEGTHCVISGHRGLPSAKLFTDLDKLMVGDIFMMRILDQVLTYQIDQILIVEPHESQDLLPVEGEDLCTLVTCTPYGINSHRLLVRGRRIENIEEAEIVHVTSDAMQIEPILVAPVVAAPMLLVLLIGLMIPRKRRGKG